MDDGARRARLEPLAMATTRLSINSESSGSERLAGSAISTASHVAGGASRGASSGGSGAEALIARTTTRRGPLVGMARSVFRRAIADGATCGTPTAFVASNASPTSSTPSARMLTGPMPSSGTGIAKRALGRVITGFRPWRRTTLCSASIISGRFSFLHGARRS